MRFWHSVVSVMLVTLILLLGMLGISSYFAEVWEFIGAKVSLVRLALPLCGALVWCFAILYVVTGRKRKRNQKYLSLANDGGTVSISTDAIAEYVAKLVVEFPSIVQMKPKIIPARNSINVLIQVKAKAGSQISEACQLLQERVRESLSSGLGISQVGSVEVSVEEIVSEHVLG